MCEIKTYEKMNVTIKELLELKGDNISLYSLKRIDELEQENIELKQKVKWLLSR